MPESNTLLSAGRYAKVHLADGQLLVPARQAKILITPEQLQNNHGIDCVPFEGEWVPACGLDKSFRATSPHGQLLLVLQEGVLALAIGCEQVSWLILPTAPQSLPMPLMWWGSPMCALASDPDSESRQPLWVSHVEAIWQGLDQQLEEENAPESLAS